MVIPGKSPDGPVTLSVKKNCITIGFEGPERTTVLSYDLEGRLWAAIFDGITYRRGLDGKMIAKWRPVGGERLRRTLAQPEALRVESRARKLVAKLWKGVQAKRVQFRHPLPPLGIEALHQALAFDENRSRADAQRYFQVYQPVGILPPDQYMAVVLQLTEGCSFNTCTFCTFYRDRPFRIKTPEAFRQHMVAVKDLLGKGLSLRRTIFLGDANALVVPMKKLVPLVEIVHDEFDVEALGGLFAFLDGFSGEKKSIDDYADLRALGLKRVYIGMESGNPDLLKFLKKPGKIEDVVTAVQTIKAAGVSVGVIVLLGAGGRQFSRAHVKDTIRALNEMQLDQGDLLYFSELVTSEDMAYAQDAFRAHLQPLNKEERLAQGEAIEKELKFDKSRGFPSISRYDIREFIY